jgi:hypothetical protein
MPHEGPSDATAAALIAAGDGWLAEIAPLVDAADPRGTVSPRSRVLCAGLGVLAVAAYRALGGSARAGEVGRAAALLALVTKVDDQVIDAKGFHGGPDRAALPARTRAFLAPTLASIRTGLPATGEPRCALAAEAGRALAGLASTPARLDRVLATIAAGWEVQVEAVRVLTAPPGSVGRDAIAAVTGAISGAWLFLIAVVGELPADARRAMTADEERAFHAWGFAIQRADALADLAKDLADGHLSSYAAALLHDRAPAALEAAIARGDDAAVYALARAHGVDRDGLADAGELARLRASLPELGEVGPLLDFIHSYLVRRWQAHPAHGGARHGVPTAAARLFAGVGEG